MAVPHDSDIIRRIPKVSPRKRKRGYQEIASFRTLRDVVSQKKSVREMEAASSSKRRRTTKKPRLVETVNSLPLNEFIDRYVPPCTIHIQPAQDNGDDYQEEKQTPRINSDDSQGYSIQIYTSSTIPKTHFDACFSLIKLTSAETYKNSRNGWSPAKKKAEMKLPDMCYLLLMRKPNGSNKLKEHMAPLGDDDLGGFLSFMTTYEDGLPVLYCYEIHLAPKLQRKGVGNKMMRIYENIGRNIGLEKAMLTVYKSNINGLKFYEQLGFVEDESSPRPMMLRNGHAMNFDYMILSKSLKGMAESQDIQSDRKNASNNV
ncbi:N alpha-acetyl-transferase [Ophidiomyces ophidiicola]|nr:N alpha-acetyl-transferase [Ophidiomyces ophidiicola]KAI1964845.1 N alpha-acetyl-transferase [Ophidiomyces ophidiicola]